MMKQFLAVGLVIVLLALALGNFPAGQLYGNVQNPEGMQCGDDYVIVTLKQTVHMGSMDGYMFTHDAQGLRDAECYETTWAELRDGGASSTTIYSATWGEYDISNYLEAETEYDPYRRNWRSGSYLKDGPSSYTLINYLQGEGERYSSDNKKLLTINIMLTDQGGQGDGIPEEDATEDSGQGAEPGADTGQPPSPQNLFEALVSWLTDMVTRLLTLGG